MVLRVVNRESVEYLELRDSIAEQGPLNSICVRPSPRRPGKYEVVDGLYRYTACLRIAAAGDALHREAHLTDDDVLAIQIQANALRPETTPMEYARQIKRIMDAIGPAGKDATLADVSNLIHKSPDWISRQLWLLSLQPDIQMAVERGEIPLGSAYVLAKLPRVQQAQFLDAGEDGPGAGFAPVAARLRQADSRGRPAREAGRLLHRISSQCLLRPLKEVLAEYREHHLGGLAVVKAE